MSIFGWLPNADKQSIIERELANGDLNNRRTGFDDRVGAWNWQDSFGAWMAGTNKEEVLEGAIKKKNEQLQQAFQPRITEAGSKLGGLTQQLTSVKNLTEAEIDQKITADERRGTALQTEIATNPDFDSGSLSETATAGDILGASSKARRDALRRKEEKDKAEIKGEKRYQEKRLDAQRDEERQYRRYTDEKSDRRYNLEQDRIFSEKQERRKDRALERQMGAETNAMNMQFKYAQLAQSDRRNAQDRKDKALMTLISGLGNLGAAFTI